MCADPGMWTTNSTSTDSAVSIYYPQEALQETIDELELEYKAATLKLWGERFRKQRSFSKRKNDPRPYRANFKTKQRRKSARHG